MKETATSRVFPSLFPATIQRDLLRRCLASVTQHAPSHTEVIVVDDASTDGSAQMVLDRVSTSPPDLPPDESRVLHCRQRGLAIDLPKVRLLSCSITMQR